MPYNVKENRKANLISHDIMKLKETIDYTVFGFELGL